MKKNKTSKLIDMLQKVFSCNVPELAEEFGIRPATMKAWKYKVCFPSPVIVQKALEKGVSRKILERLLFEDFLSYQKKKVVLKKHR